MILKPDLMAAMGIARIAIAKQIGYMISHFMTTCKGNSGPNYYG